MAHIIIYIYIGNIRIYKDVQGLRFRVSQNPRYPVGVPIMRIHNLLGYGRATLIWETSIFVGSQRSG